jgi:hypothetical protein
MVNGLHLVKTKRNEDTVAALRRNSSTMPLSFSTDHAAKATL